MDSKSDQAPASDGGEFSQSLPEAIERIATMYGLALGGGWDDYDAICILDQIREDLPKRHEAMRKLRAQIPNPAWIDAAAEEIAEECWGIAETMHVEDRKTWIAAILRRHSGEGVGE